jgi:Ca2+-binding RTX toxin-like protein
MDPRFDHSAGRRRRGQIARRGDLRLVTVTVLFSAGLVLTTPAQAANTKTYSCFGQVATIVGTARADTIYGTTGDDVIFAGRGDDTVLGEPLDSNDEPIGAGNDLICGGPGADRILTGLNGDDRINGGDGDDTVGGRSELGSDVLQGNAGDDFLRDALDDSGDNVFRGGTGDDTIVGGDHSSSRMYGGDGNDSLLALAPFVVDRLFGQAGADTIDARDWVQEEGAPPDTFTPDIVDGGTDAAGTVDTCLLDSADTYADCETVQFGF